jgi:DNA polymerase III sliding clamp (beta) subunit (PCNA family)
MLIFEAKTQDAHVWKLLSEILHHTISIACFEIDKNGIVLNMMDSNRKIHLNLVLNNENFTEYSFNYPTKLYIGLKSQNLVSVLKCVKKKNSISFQIDDSNMDELKICIYPAKDGGRLILSNILIYTVQHLDIELPEGYSKPIVVQSSEYTGACKDLTNLSNSVIKLQANSKSMKLTSSLEAVYSRDITIGTQSNDKFDYLQHFNSDVFVKIAKLGGMSSNVHIFAQKNLPLMFRTNIGNIGKLCIYIKSNEEIEQDK